MKTVIEMARSVGAGEPESLYGRTDYVVMTRCEFERFAELVRADEREACAKVCEARAEEEVGMAYAGIALDCAAAIRSRSSEH